MGSRGVIDEYSFPYQGNLAVVKRTDRRWAIDTYYALINGKDAVRETLTSDDRRVVRVNERNYSVRDANQE